MIRISSTRVKEGPDSAAMELGPETHTVTACSPLILYLGLQIYKDYFLGTRRTYFGMFGAPGHWLYNWTLRVSSSEVPLADPSLDRCLLLPLACAVLQRPKSERARRAICL